MKILILLFLPFTLLAQQPQAGIRGHAMGNTGLCFTDAAAISLNPAGLAFSEGIHAQAYTEQRFLTRSINTTALGVGWSGRYGAAVIHAHSFGLDAYRQQSIRLTYARKISRGVAAGLGFHYNTLYIEGYGRKGYANASAGFNARLGANWQLGALVDSPFQVRKTADKADNDRTTIAVGIEYHPVKSVVLTAELYKTLAAPLSPRAGIEYMAHKKCFLRAGVNGSPFQVSGGVGLRLGSLTLDLSTAWHSRLGITPGFGVRWEREKGAGSRE